MRRKPKQQRSKQMVSDIIQASREHLLEFGLEGFSTATIAQKAGVSVGSMYQYFESKEQLLDAVASTLVDEIIKELDNIVGTQLGNGFRDFCKALISYIFDYISSQQLVFSALLSPGAEKRLLLGSSRIESHFTDLFRAYALQHHAELPTTSLPSAVFVTFTSVLTVALRMQMVNRATIDQEAITDMLVESCLAAVFGSAYSE
jgi:AcrR family transcriptional regulator